MKEKIITAFKDNHRDLVISKKTGQFEDVLYNTGYETAILFVLGLMGISKEEALNMNFKEEFKMTNISKLCYELYKIDWKYDHHITPEVEKDNMKNYYNEFVLNGSEYTYEDFLNEFGYDGDLYVCYEEFCDNEYNDKEYICSLLNNEKLIQMYYNDTKN